ncbi:MAG: tandem-95 repeat protein, partial [Planctomycetes bacterium]|nr:tandem-95 repeat protein [Planctomycetota bacterium]
ADPDLPAQTLTYSLAGGADAALFAIDGSTGQLRFLAAPDREAPADANADNVYLVNVLVIDGNGGSDSQDLAVTVTDVDEFDASPIADADPAADAVDENAANGAAVGVTAFASDGDATNSAITYSLDDDAGGRFTIDAAGGMVTVADGSLLDREAAASHAIIVRATSADGSSSTRTITINLNDVDEFDVGAVSDADAAVNAVDENAAAGTTVGVTASAADADATNSTIAYSLDDDASGRFAIDAASGVVMVAGPLDYEAATSYGITVRASSADGSFSTRSVTIAVNPQNDNAPVITSDGGGATASLNVVENNIAVTTIAATDADLPAQTLSYAIAGGADAALFALDAATGDLNFLTAPDLEAPADADGDNVYEVTVQADDGAGGTDSQTIFVAITGVNDTPPVITANSLTISEGQSVTLTAADLTTADPESAPAELTYTASNITGGRFELVSAPGIAVTSFTQQQINNDEVLFVHNGGETAPAYDIAVSDGLLIAGPQAASIAFTNVNDAPVAADDAYTVAEDGVLAVAAPAGVLSNDSDVDSAPITPVLVNGPSQGVLTLAADGSFNYTPAADFHGREDFTYRAGDGALTSNLATVVITVTPVNDAPVAQTETFTVGNNGVLTVASPGLLGNDADVDGDPLTAQLVSAPVFGALTLNADGSFRYVPDVNQSGLMTFTYEAFDGTAASQTITVKVTVEAVAAGGAPGVGVGIPFIPGLPPLGGLDNDDDDSTLLALLQTQEEREDELLSPTDDTNNSRGRSGPAAGGGKRNGDENELLVEDLLDDAYSIVWIPQYDQPAGPASGDRSEASDADARSDSGMTAADFQMLSSRLDTFNREVEMDLQQHTVVAGAAMALTSSAAAGYVLWSLRAGTLVAGFITSLPAWATLDVLAVAEVGYGAAAAGRDDQRESLLDLVTRHTPSSPDGST